MYRALLCGLGVGWAATVGGQTPVSVHPPTLPGTVVPAPGVAAPRTMPVSDISRPLTEAMPTSPGVPAAMPTAANPSCTTCGTTCAKASCTRTLVSRLSEWLCYKPAPRVLPVFTPTPYVGSYGTSFPCRQDAAGCGTTAPAKPTPQPACKDGKCGTPLISGRLFGRCDPCRDTLLDRALRCLTPQQFDRCSPCGVGCPNGGVAITTPASGPLNCSVGCGPTTPGLCGQRPYSFRFANPLCPPVAPGYGTANATAPAAQPTPATTLPTVPPTAPTTTPAAPAVNKPFTNP